MKKKKIIDTNIIVRFLLNDIPSQVDEIVSLFNNSDEKSIDIPDAIVIETAFALSHHYKINKLDVTSKIDAMLEYSKFNINKPVFKLTLSFFNKYNISFVDAYLCALSTDESYEMLYTFDKKILKVKDISASSPH